MIRPAGWGAGSKHQSVYVTEQDAIDRVNWLKQFGIWTGYSRFLDGYMLLHDIPFSLPEIKMGLRALDRR